MEDQIFILLGSNQGEREKMLQQATEAIERICGKIVRQSCIYETAPWGFESEQWFLNQVIQIKSFLVPETLLEKLLAIELQLGRVRTNAQYSSRAIDLDLLYYSSIHLETRLLEIPHPRLHLRRFTLMPLSEIAPDFVHPVLKKTQLELLELLQDNSKVYKLIPDKI
ncbi:MAG: 2-amino-4-hydroxy-6-hydroxymethyldihydropteridine diphosphokinase [Bacteroidales bacterium]|jgi:2-amino-4-hydroxy-6-hydroxymethyldihydropteridine diphosphokinase|nr:2-amino-4-hydroxy-6-hydroxymethyldihydropteridine diphosphokinase [Bacteroidales bacterium]